MKRAKKSNPYWCCWFWRLAIVLILLLGVGIGLAEAQERSADGKRPLESGGVLWERYLEGLALLDDGGLDALPEALKIFDEVIGQNPQFQNVYLDAGEACLLQYELRAQAEPVWLERAEDYANQLLAVQPSSADAHVLLAKIHGDRGAQSRARFHILRALKYDPSHVEARFIRLALLIREDKADEAVAFAEETSGYVSGQPLLYKQLGLMLLPLHRPDAVLRYLALAVDQGIWDVGMVKAYAVTSLQLHEYARAADFFAVLCADFPEDQTLLLQAEHAYALAGSYGSAVRFAERYLAEYPEDADARARLTMYRKQVADASEEAIP